MQFIKYFATGVNIFQFSCHFTELVEVHGTAPILVQLGDDPIQLLTGEGAELLGNEGPEGVHGDKALPVLVIDPEGVLQLIDGVDVGVLHQELSAQLAELGQLDLQVSLMNCFNM